MESNGHERRTGKHVRALMTQAGEGFVVVGADGRIRLFNEAAESLLGTSRTDAHGHTLEEIGIVEIATLVDEAHGGAEPTPVVIDLGERVLSCRATRYEDGDGPGVAIVVRDDTELVAQHERSRAILEGASDGLVVFAPDDRITYANPAACALLGSDPDELIGRHTTLHELLGAEIPEDAGETPEPGVAQEIELAEPEHRVLVVRTNPVVDRCGTYLGCVSSLHDVTAEREIAVMKNEFVSMVSHELRTPLTSIKGYVDLIVEGEAGEINEIQREFLQIVQENSDRLVSLINDLLDISRMESGRVHLRVEPLEMPEIVQGVCDTFRTMAEQGTVELTWDAEENLPRAAGDRDRVGQVLMNFVSNAIK
ncbi:MAG: histidine kinase dimerization/phospho-acceptor domain-containing protein, partial [Actinomycetota bacterium]|nr:histidine kinase dimerization/phospho-acceptor domain-containing protein [Actinomycetota bacterium]